MTHRFLWRDLEDEREPDTFVMTSVNMGDRPSGIIAMIVLRKTAEMSKNEFPQACQTIISNSYMDDIIDSVDLVDAASKVMGEIDKVLDKGDFKIKEWTCSGRTRGCSTDADVEQKAIQLLSNLSVTTNSTERVLGMGWDPQNDTFGYKGKLNFSIKRRKVHLEKGPDLSYEQVPTSVPAPLTKRQVLFQVSGVYDPLGLISPFTFRAKLMLRELWGQEKRVDWDDAIPDHLRHEWITFFEELFQLENVSIPRWIKPRKSIEEPELILFSDASNEAYAQRPTFVGR